MGMHPMWGSRRTAACEERAAALIGPISPRCALIKNRCQGTVRVPRHDAVGMRDVDLSDEHEFWGYPHPRPPKHAYGQARVSKSQVSSAVSPIAELGGQYLLVRFTESAVAPMLPCCVSGHAVHSVTCGFRWILPGQANRWQTARPYQRTPVTCSWAGRGSGSKYLVRHGQ
jgi:hypothetical protein